MRVSLLCILWHFRQDIYLLIAVDVTDESVILVRGNHKYTLKIPDSYTGLHNGVVSQMAKMEVVGFLLTTHAKPMPP